MKLKSISIHKFKFNFCNIILIKLCNVYNLLVQRIPGSLKMDTKYICSPQSFKPANMETDQRKLMTKINSIKFSSRNLYKLSGSELSSMVI